MSFQSVLIGFPSGFYVNYCHVDCGPGVVKGLEDTSYIETTLTTCKTSKGKSTCPQQCDFGEYKRTCSLEYNSCKVSLLLLHLKLRIQDNLIISSSFLTGLTRTVSLIPVLKAALLELLLMKMVLNFLQNVLKP